MKVLLRFTALLVLFVSLVVLVLYALIYFNFDFINVIQKNSLNEIGDALGGMTSPVIGIISSVLVFLSFREQNIANALIIKSRDEDGVKDTVRDFSSKIDLKFDKLYHAVSHTMGEVAITSVVDDILKYNVVKQQALASPTEALLKQKDQLHENISGCKILLRDIMIVVTYCGYYATYLSGETGRNKGEAITEYLEMYLTEFEMYFIHKINNHDHDIP